MESEKNRVDDAIRGLLRSLPPEKPAEAMNARILEAVRTVKSPAERRSDRNVLAWTIALSAVVLGLGAWGLYACIDRESFSLASLWPDFDRADRFSIGAGRWPERTETIGVWIPFAGITLLLLAADTLFRRRFLKRRHGHRH